MKQMTQWWGHAFCAEATSDVKFSPPSINTPHITFNMTLWLENLQGITLVHYITFI